MTRPSTLTFQLFTLVKIITKIFVQYPRVEPTCKQCFTANGRLVMEISVILHRKGKNTVVAESTLGPGLVSTSFSSRVKSGM